MSAPDAWSPATVTDAVGAGHTQAYRVQKAPGDIQITVVTAGQTRRFQADGVAGRLSVVDDTVAIPLSSSGGSTPDKVELFHGADDSHNDVPLAAGERYLTAAGAGILIAAQTLTGWSLLVRTAGPSDQVVGQLPAGQIGAVGADANGALLAFTPVLASTPDVDLVDFTAGTVSTMQSTALTDAHPLVALSPQGAAWTDGSDLVRIPRTGGTEVRRGIGGAATALAVLDTSSAWVGSGHLLTGLADPSQAALDHGPVLVADELFVSNLLGYQAIVGSNRAYAQPFNAGQVGGVGGALDLGAANARLDELRLGAGFVARHDDSNPRGTLTPFTHNGPSLATPNATQFTSPEHGRRLWDVSGRFRALGNGTDTAVILSSVPLPGVNPPGPDMTVPIAAGVDTIELSGPRLLVHRPGSSMSQLYVLGSSTVSQLPLGAALWGGTVAWQNPDGSIQAQDLNSGALPVTVRPAGVPLPCPVCTPSVTATLHVASGMVFWSWYGENRVAFLSGAPTISLPDGDLTHSRLSTGVLAAVDPLTSVLSVTDLLDPALPSYQVADAPVAFDVDEHYVTWGDSAYWTHIAPLPFATPQTAALSYSWTESGDVVPASYNASQVATRWYHHADFTQPSTPRVVVRNSAGTVVSDIWFSPWENLLAGSVDLDWDGTTRNGVDAAAPGLYTWSVTGYNAEVPVSTETGTVAVRDPRRPSISVTSRPASLAYGRSGTITAHVLLGGVGADGLPVALQQRPHGTGAWGTLTTRATGTGSSKGLVQFTVSPSANTDYRITYAGATYGPVSSVSSPWTTLVATTVTAVTSASRLRAGTSVAVSGSVAPHHAGQIVYVQRYYSRAWHTIANVRLSATSAFRYVFRPAHGSYSLRVVKPADTDHALGTSPTVVLTVS